MWCWLLFKICPIRLDFMSLQDFNVIDYFGGFLSVLQIKDSAETRRHFSQHYIWTSKKSLPWKWKYGFSFTPECLNKGQLEFSHGFYFKLYLSGIRHCLIPILVYSFDFVPFSPFASLLVISTLVYSFWGLFFFRLPDKFPEESRVLVVDPMLATGTILMAGAPTIMFSDGIILWLGGGGGWGWAMAPLNFLYINEN